MDALMGKSIPKGTNVRNAILGTENFFMWITVFILFLIVIPILLVLAFTIWFALWIPSIPYLLLTKRNIWKDLTNNLNREEKQ
jgi:uncharacterized membrane protein